MNQVILVGRLAKDPDIRYAKGNELTAVARYTLAVERRFSKDLDQEVSADFISCAAFGKAAEFAERYLRRGVKIAVTGRLRTGSYMDRKGQKVYTTDVVIENQEFVESLSACR